MPRVQLPPGCAGFADGDQKFMAERGPGSFVNLEEGSPQLKKLQNQDYASAGLVDAGPEKFFVKKGPEGRFCFSCPDNTIWHSWTRVCPSCGAETRPESEMVRDVTLDDYFPPVAM